MMLESVPTALGQTAVWAVFLKISRSYISRIEKRAIERSGVGDFHEEAERFGPFDFEFGVVCERHVFGLHFGEKRRVGGFDRAPVIEFGRVARRDETTIRERKRKRLGRKALRKKKTSVSAFDKTERSEVWPAFLNVSRTRRKKGLLEVEKEA